MRPHILKVVPKNVREMVNMREVDEQVVGSNQIWFEVLQVFVPGSAEERSRLHASIANPPACSQPMAAFRHLQGWRNDLKRLQQLGGHPGDHRNLFAAMHSIFERVFSNGEPLLQHRWNTLRDRLGCHMSSIR